MHPEQLPSRAFATVTFAVDWAYLRDLNLLCHRVDGDLETVVRRALSDYAQRLAVDAVHPKRQRRRRRWSLALAALGGLIVGALVATLIR